MKTYAISIPMAGHAYIEVEANSEAEATEKAFAEAGKEHIEDFEFLKKFTSGNVCYCPSPWEVEVDCIDEGDDE